jgi:hypothetical protein
MRERERGGEERCENECVGKRRVCVGNGRRERACVEREREREREIVCVERRGKREGVGVERESVWKERVCGRECVVWREERKNVCMCVYVCVYGKEWVSLCVWMNVERRLVCVCVWNGKKYVFHGHVFHGFDTSVILLPYHTVLLPKLRLRVITVTLNRLLLCMHEAHEKKLVFRPFCSPPF